MKTIQFFLILLFTLVIVPRGIANPLTDSLKQTEKKYVMRGLMRLHSQGQFWYGGRIVSRNPTADFNFTYDRKKWGMQLFKAVDTKDHTTDINFLLAVVNKNFKLNNRLTLTPSVGFLFEQSRSFADKGTDVVFIFQTSYKLTKMLTIDHSALFGNLLLEPEEKDWVNRLRLLYSYKHIDITCWLWHNNSVFDNAAYVSSTLSVFYSRVKMNEHVFLNFGISGTVMTYSSNEAVDPKNNGILFTFSSLLH